MSKCIDCGDEFSDIDDLKNHQIRGQIGSGCWNGVTKMQTCISCGTEIPVGNGQLCRRCLATGIQSHKWKDKRIHKPDNQIVDIPTKPVKKKRDK